MRITNVAPDVYVAIGEAYDSNSTVLVSGSEALLIDAVGSAADAEELRRWIERDLRKSVRFIISSHYFSDHMAALNFFPAADRIAHSMYMHTWTSERFRSADEERHFAVPTITFDDRMSLRWGAHRLELFYNPGHTMSTIGIDIPTADLLHVGDTIVGNMTYLAYSPPELIANAIECASRRGRRWVLTSHGEPRPSIALQHAASYLRTLGEKCAKAFARDDVDAIRSLAIDDCLPPGVTGTDFETVFHLRNLDTIIEKRHFAFDAPLVAAGLS